MIRVLYCGDTEIENTTVHKGFDYYNFTYAIDDSEHLKEALAAAGNISVDHLDIMEIHPRFPTELAELARYDVVILSDVGYNNLSLTPGFRPPHRVPMGTNRVESINRYVHEEGGGLLMIGGWMSFSGIYGKAGYAGTSIEELLPVKCHVGVDDREEVVEGFQPEIVDPRHPVMDGLPWDDEFILLGYNRVTLKPDAQLLASRGEDPVIAVTESGAGRTAVFTSDVAPHWAGSFISWAGYDRFWQQLVRWLATGA